MTLPGVKVIDFEVNREDVVGGALDLIKKLRPNWKADEIKTTVFTDGITNKLVGCRLKSDDAKTDMVLVRVYGEETERIIDRNIEMLNMRLLHAAGCSEPLYCKFTNGICYGFSPGICLDEKLVRDPKVCRLFASEMVRMQRVNPLELLKTMEGGESIQFDTEPCLFKKINKFLSNVPDEYPDSEKNERFKRDIKSKAELTAELKQMQGIIESMNCPIVFAHNDLLLKNIVYNEERDRAYFIDFEYGAFNYLPFDIGNHFCEYAGIDEVDYSLYPDKTYQMKWLRMYLEIKFEDEGKQASDVSEQVVETLYVQVQKFALMAHFFWGLWALVQARYSTIDFDYMDYAKVRLGEYFSRKEEFLAL